MNKSGVKIGRKYIYKTDVADKNPCISIPKVIKDNYVWRIHYLLKDGPSLHNNALYSDMSGVRIDHFEKNWILWD